MQSHSFKKKKFLSNMFFEWLKKNSEYLKKSNQNTMPETITVVALNKLYFDWQLKIRLKTILVVFSVTKTKKLKKVEVDQVGM